MVNRAEAPLAPAPGMVIPQPGSYSHVHWITRSSTDPRASLVPDECDKQKAGQLEDIRDIEEEDHERMLQLREQVAASPRCFPTAAQQDAGYRRLSLESTVPNLTTSPSKSNV